MTRRESLDELAARAALRPHGNVLHVRPVRERASTAEQARALGDATDGGTPPTIGRPGLEGIPVPPAGGSGPADGGDAA